MLGNRFAAADDLIIYARTFVFIIIFPGNLNASELTFGKKLIDEWRAYWLKEIYLVLSDGSPGTTSTCMKQAKKGW